MMTIVDRIICVNRGAEKVSVKAYSRYVHQGKREALRIAHTMLEQGIERDGADDYQTFLTKRLRQSAVNFSTLPPGHRDYQRR